MQIITVIGWNCFSHGAGWRLAAGGWRWVVRHGLHVVRSIALGGGQPRPGTARPSQGPALRTVIKGRRHGNHTSRQQAGSRQQAQAWPAYACPMPVPCPSHACPAQTSSPSPLRHQASGCHPIRNHRPPPTAPPCRFHSIGWRRIHVVISCRLLLLLLLMVCWCRCGSLGLPRLCCRSRR